MRVVPLASSLLSKSIKHTLMEAAIKSKCEHLQSHFDFLNNAYWVSLFFRETTC
jgi:hypothetical protein